MIKVIVVDDDKMARQGLIHTVPWAQFGMVVVGEAGNGKVGLQLLDQHEVDLVLTDLEMPLLDGIEFMKKAATKHPEVRFAVLSFHQQFELVREALRLGALDYIAKAELEREQIDRVLGRIRDRFVAELPTQATANPEAPQRWTSNQAWVAIRRMASGPWAGDALPLAVADDGLVVLTEAPLNPVPGWAGFLVTGLLNEPWSAIRDWLLRYRSGNWFYDGQSPVDLTYASDTDQPDQSTAEAELRNRLADYPWIVDDMEGQTLVRDLMAARLAPPRLHLVLTFTAELWARTYGVARLAGLPSVGVLAEWSVAERWLGDFRQAVRMALSRPDYSMTVQASVVRAQGIIDQEFGSALTAEDVSARVNMSRSYFSECFHALVGKTFLESLREARMNRARQLLLVGNEAVYKIAEAVGYQDEKYFSRQFKETFGVLPKELRLRADSSTES